MQRSKKLMAAHWRVAGLLSAPLWALAPSWVAAGPVGGNIVGGSGSIARPNANLTEIHQNSDRLAINWQQFDVNANEVVKFVQPSAQSIALNRILDSKQSLILGRIEANGRVFLVNPRGIIFGKDATINVAGLVASSLDIDSKNFINGNFEFNDKGGEGVVVNQGTIEAAVGGAVLLLGKVVINAGDIRAQQGSVRLVSAGGAVISFDDNEQLGIQITAQQQQKIAEQNDAVRNSGTINAAGGYIALTGATTADLFTNAVNNEGVLVASSVQNQGGVIELTGADIRSSGTLAADGTRGGTIQLHAQDLILTENNAAISATGSNGNGGHIELLGDRIGILNNSRIDASGSNGGGVVHVGGALHGERDGAAPRNAKRTVVDSSSTIYADAQTNGNGGEVVLWSDDVTYFGGNIFARGGSNGGDGGNVEVSGKQSLNFSGYVDTSAPHGNMGNLLLDPAIINIINGSGGAQDAGVADGIINSGDSPSPYQISEQALEALTSNVTLTATQQINIANLADNELLFNPNGGTVTFNVAATSGTASFTMADVNDTIRVNNGNLVINVTNTNPTLSSSSGATNVALGNLTTTTAGNITVTASSSCTSGITSCTSAALTLNGSAITSAGSVSIQGDSTATSSISAATSNNVAMNLGNISAGNTVSVIGSSIANNTFTSSTTGNVLVTVGNVDAGGAVTVHGTSNATSNLFSGATAGSAALTIGNVAASGVVDIDSVSSATNASFASTGNAQATVGSILVNTNSNIQIAATSSKTPSLENIYIGGNYISNGGNISMSGYTLNLNANAVIDTTGTTTLTYTTLVQNGFSLTQGSINDIYVGDISGSALAGDLGFSQSNIDFFAGSGLLLSAKNNILLGNATITSPSATSVQLIADSDHSGVGDISIASGKVFNLNGRSLIASGVNAQIDGSITNSGAGSQQFTTTGAIAMGSGGSLTSGSGNIALNAGTGGVGGITMANGASIASTTGQLALTAANNIALGTLTTGNTSTSAVNITSTAGAITNAGAATNISASAAGSRVALNAVSGIAAGLSIADLMLTNSGSGAVSLINNRALQISAFTNTPATAASVMTTGANSNLTIAGNVSSGNNLALTSSGTFSVTDGFTVNSNAGTLAINSAGNAAITGLASANNTASAISVISGGAISDNGNANADITATTTGAAVTLQAASGIGTAANAIDINVLNIAATNGASGDIALHALGSFTFGAINNSAAAGAVVALSSDGNLTINNITTNNGAITLSAADHVALASGAALQSNNGAVTITADTNTNGVGQIAMGSGTINSGSGTIALSAAQDISLNQLTTTNAATGAVSITSTAGKILGNFDGAPDITAANAGARVTLHAATGIDAGGSNPLELSILDLSATNTTSGGINLSNDRTLQVTSFANSASGNTAISIFGAGNDLVFANMLQNGGGSVALTATRNINLQNMANVAALSTNSVAVNYAQSIAAGSISSTGNANVAGNLTGTTGNIDLQTVALGGGPHLFSTVSGDINLGAVSGSTAFQLSSGRNISVAGIALGAGNFSASSTTNGTLTASGDISASAVTLNAFSAVNLQHIFASGAVAVIADSIDLNANLLSNGAMTLTGTTQLQNDIVLSTTSAGALQLVGSVIGNGHALTLAAGNNLVCIACTAGASASGLAALDIQSSIKTVLGATAVNGNATINADQEIYLNGDTTITGNLALLADANNDGIGLAGLLTGKQLNVGGTLTLQPIALSSLATPAQCAAPTGLPQMPSTPQTPNVPPLDQAALAHSDVQVAVQEGGKYELAASDAMLRNAPQIAYLNNNCPSDSATAHKRGGQCDASMLDFLGTFLIDNQIPKNGN